jgi:alpha-glucosidase
VRYWPAYAGRDAMRTPLPWRGGPGGGFTGPGTVPWLPLGEIGGVNVEDQRSDPSSVLHLARDLIALRRRTPDLQTGAYATIPAPARTWVWRRGQGVVVAVNLSDDEATVDALAGDVLVSTERRRPAPAVSGGLTLAPWEGLVVAAR